MSTDSAGRPVRRYTVRLEVMPPPDGSGAARDWQHVTYKAVTSLGEHKAVAMAVLRHSRTDPDIRLSTVEVVRAENDWASDPENLLDYFGGCD